MCGGQMDTGGKIDGLLFNGYQCVDALLVFSYLFLLTIQWYWYYQPHLTDEETEPHIISLVLA